MPVLLDYFTAVAAFGGLLLGLWAAWRTFLDDRVKLRVTACLKRFDNSRLVDGQIDEVGVTQDPSSFSEGFVAVSVTNMSKFPIALASVDLVLKDGEERGISPGFSAIEPRRRRELSYPLLEKNRPDDLGNVAPRTCCLAECGRSAVWR